MSLQSRLAALITAIGADVKALQTSMATKATDSLVMHLAGNETVAGIKTFTEASLILGDGANAPIFITSGGAGQFRGFGITTNNVARWYILGTTAPEAGSNAGTNLNVYAFADDGVTVLSVPIAIARATGLVTMQGGISTLSSNVTGLTGANQASRYAGGTTTGPPTTGTFQLRDWIVATDGIWICTVAGSPGTWAQPVAVETLPLTAFNAKGDLLAGTADNTMALLTLGTAGQTAIVDTAQSTGLKYVALCEVFPFTQTGTAVTAVGKSKIPLRADYAVESIQAYSTVAPTGAAIIVDVNKNGTTLFTTQGNRPTIAINGNASTTTMPDVTTFTTGDVLSVDVDQVGSTVAGGDSLTVVIRLRRI